MPDYYSNVWTNKKSTGETCRFLSAIYVYTVFSALFIRQYFTIERFAVYHKLKRSVALFLVVCDLIRTASELLGDAALLPIGREARIKSKSLKRGNKSVD